MFQMPKGILFFMLFLKNAIERIDLLVECGLVNLIFVTLAANRIKSVENLSSLRQLRFLDLSENQIGTLSCG